MRDFYGSRDVRPRADLRRFDEPLATRGAGAAATHPGRARGGATRPTRRETRRLIASNKVEGTAVYARDGSRLGTIYNFMVDKYSGQVEYAVMRYGGFMGLGQRYYPLPWTTLTYDVRAGGYRINLAHCDMAHAPSFTRDDEPDFNREYGRSVHDYYGIRY